MSDSESAAGQGGQTKMERVHTSESEQGMGEPTDSVMSLDGFCSQANLSAQEQQKKQEEAELELRLSVAEDVEYWERISSTCYMEDAPTEAQLDSAKVGEEFRDYATHWVRNGRGGLDVIQDFASHKSIRDQRYERRQKRKDKKAAAGDAKKAAVALGSVHGRAPPRNGGGGGNNDPDFYTEVKVEMDFDPNEALAALSKIDEKLEKIDDICFNLPEVEKEQREILGKAYAHMLAKFKEPRLKKRYGFNRQDHRMAPLQFGGDVPSYFANVSDGSIYRRKVLSIAGLRNLIIYGPVIYHQLTEKNFVGDPNAYSGDVGLALMRRVTGNVVDLDSTVLRCTDSATLNAINAHNKHKKMTAFKNSDDFANSDQATEIAINCSLPMMAEFAKILKLSDQATKDRRIHESQIERPIPMATHNTDRGRWPVWHYVNAGQNSFHCNVPTMSDVNGALLKAPYHCIQLWLLMHTISEGEDLENRIDDFFENCVVDSCFNMKWKAIEEFAVKMRHEGTITYVLQRVQAANQSVFTMEFFDKDNDDQENEVAEMQKLMSGKTGRDKDGKIRPIAKEEVAAWVRDPSVTF